MAAIKKTTTRRASGKKVGKGAVKGKKSARGSSAPVGKHLVIVESPAKAKTINKYLGSDYVVKASMGHVRDLPSKEMGVDVENHFAPTYIALDGRKKVLVELRRYAKSAPRVFLATDMDREGEAIAWHLAEELKISPDRLSRVVFNEITDGAIKEAFANAHSLDMNKVNAQQARRILDRIVGYEVSPLLWRKVARGLSAGRVQTVAVRLIVDRERQRDAFMPEEYWRIGGIFTPDMKAAAGIAEKWRALMATRDAKDKPPTQDRQQQFMVEHNTFRAELVRWKDKKFQADNADTVADVVKAMGLTVDSLDRATDPKGKGPAENLVTISAGIGKATSPFKVGQITQRDRRSSPPGPFTTVTMQQTASVQLYFGASRTMRLAQQLYEGVEVPGQGSVGLITYMRTDSTQLSGEAVNHARQFITDSFGDEYLPEKPRRFASGKRAQEAHEAIRPTDVTRTPDQLRSCLDDAQFKLYQLIWRRFVACQMAGALWKTTEATIVAETSAGQAQFKALGRRLAFDGYMKVAGLPRGGDQILPELTENQPVAPVQVDPAQHFTKPPPRYTEASLVKALEADGIGRPSTYAAIIKTIQDRNYVELTDRAFWPTHLGLVVTDKLVKHLPRIFDVRFTAHMEDELDGVEEARVEWVKVLEDFYGPFHKSLEKASEEMVHAKADTQPSEYKCDKCGLDMVYRFSKTGRYLACSGYPECKFTIPVDRDGNKLQTQLVDVACPNCSLAMVLRTGRFGPFLSCSKYPDCDGIVNIDRKGKVKHPSPPPLLIDLPCPKCQAPLNMRRSKRGPWLGCSKFPKCRGRQAWTTLDDNLKKDLEAQLEKHIENNPVAVLKDINGTPLAPDHTPQPIQQAPDSEADEGK